MMFIVMEPASMTSTKETHSPRIGLGVVIAPYNMPNTSKVIRHEK